MEHVYFISFAVIDSMGNTGFGNTEVWRKDPYLEVVDLQRTAYEIAEKFSPGGKITILNFILLRMQPPEPAPATAAGE